MRRPDFKGVVLVVMLGLVVAAGRAESVQVEPLPLTPGYFHADYSPSYAPDGRLIFIRSQRVGPPHWDFYEGIWVYSYGTTTALMPYAAFQSPVMSADGRLAAAAGGNISYRSADGRGMAVTDDDYPDSNPAWSPNAEKLAYDSLRPGGTQIFVSSLDGSDPVQLTDSPGVDAEPAWSPDGNSIAFSSSRAGSRDIWIMSASGEELRQVTFSASNESEPTWSPDGNWIAYVSDQSGNPDIWLVQLSTGRAYQLTTSSGRDTEPTWSPDGSQIVYTSFVIGGNILLYRVLHWETVGVEETSWSAVKGLYR